ncbi:hypothetical protein HMPREF3150_01566 [Pseudomonas aeruginosa]|nr:hypothetical protein HMPREF3150_01566 [Pseudomonas aeruginosa]
MAGVMVTPGEERWLKTGAYLKPSLPLLHGRRCRGPRASVAIFDWPRKRNRRVVFRTNVHLRALTAFLCEYIFSKLNNFHGCPP